MASRDDKFRWALGLFRIKGGPNSNGEYTAICPAHDDKQASLTIKAGDNGVLLHCHAKCSFDAICASIGVKTEEMTWDDVREARKRAWREGKGGGGKKAAAAPKPKAPTPTSAPAKEDTLTRYDSFQAAFGHLGKIEKVYPYCEADGKLRFWAVRIRLKDGGKTFRQCRPADPEQGDFPIVCSVPEQMRAGLIYRLGEVKAAMAAGETIYLVEGEKDADTLWRLGRAATTNPGGANKWTKADSDNLRDADVVLIPDNDNPGEKDVEQKARLLQGVARRVRVARLKEGYPELKDKGDFTDLVEAVGDEAALEILDRLAESLYNRAVAAFGQLGGYCVAGGCICQRMEDSTKLLGKFLAMITREVIRDDGVQQTRQLEIQGWQSSGAPLGRIYVDIEKYGSMDWVMKRWGSKVNIAPGSTVKDKLRYAIMEAAGGNVEEMTIYQHTGWRKIDGKWCYLHQGGCIGAENATVDLGLGLERYGLDFIAEDIDPVDAALASGSLASTIDPRVSVPMLGITYLAPLMEFLDQGGYSPAFITMLKGDSGTNKTSIASLFLTHFGDFNYDRAPASFNDTANTVGWKAFYLKDTPLLVDDYYPPTTRDEKRKMQGIAQRLSRAFGNHQDRGRLAADLSIQATRPPRALAIMTGELVPDIGVSGVGRLYIIEVGGKPIPDMEAYMDLWRRARRGELRAAMRSYIEWLLPQADNLGRETAELFEAYRSRAEEALRQSGAHSRTTNAVTHVMIGLTYMLRYFESLGLSVPETTEALLEDYWGIVTGNSVQQATESRADTPVEMFLAAVRELLTSRVCAVKDIGPGSDGGGIPKGMAGYADQANYYLMPDTIYGAAVKFYADQERMLPGNRVELLRQMKAAGLLIPDGTGKSTRLKRIDGKQLRLLWIPRWVIDGGNAPGPSGKQERMDFKEVQDDEIPEGWNAE